MKTKRLARLQLLNPLQVCTCYDLERVPELQALFGVDPLKRESFGLSIRPVQPPRHRDVHVDKTSTNYEI